jgi:hypothetical protein
MKTEEGLKKAKARYQELEAMASTGTELPPAENKERELLMGLLKIGGAMPKSPSWSSRVKAYPARTTRASVFDALEARVEGLYGEHEEAGTELKYQESRNSNNQCHLGYYQVKRVKKDKKYSKTEYTLYVSDSNVRKYFTTEDAPFAVAASPIDKMLKPTGGSNAYHIKLPTYTGKFVTLTVYTKSGESLVRVDLHKGAYPTGVETRKSMIKVEPMNVEKYYACAARAVWARMHPLSVSRAGFDDVTSRMAVEQARSERSGTNASVLDALEARVEALYGLP